MIGEERPDWVARTVRRVLDGMFGPAVPPPTCAMGPMDRRWLTVVILADDLEQGEELGFEGQEPVDLLPVAERLAFHRWLVEIGRLSELGPA